MPQTFKDTMIAYAKPQFGDPLESETPHELSSRVFMPWKYITFNGVQGHYQGEINADSREPCGRGIFVHPGKELRIGRFRDGHFHGQLHAIAEEMTPHKYPIGSGNLSQLTRLLNK
jgi:hypothetical protein